VFPFANGDLGAVSPEKLRWETLPVVEEENAVSPEKLRWETLPEEKNCGNTCQGQESDFWKI